MYSESVTSFPSPFGSAKSGALAPTFREVPNAGLGAGSLGGASGDCPDCALAVMQHPIRIKVPITSFIFGVNLICRGSYCQRVRISLSFRVRKVRVRALTAVISTSKYYTPSSTFERAPSCVLSIDSSYQINTEGD